MVDPRALLDAYAAREWGSYYEKDRFDEIAPAVFAALRRVLAYCDEVNRTMPIAAMELRGRIAAALEDDRG